jgi:uncharacterized protein YqgC (DUF456 family)
MAFINIIVALLLVLGLLGSILPFIPGTPLILGGAIIYAVATDFEPIGPWHLALLVVLAAFAYSLDYLAGALGVQKLGGSRWSMLGAIFGAIVGLFFGPPGLILGPILGAIVVEFIVSRKLRTSLRSGLGTVVGMILGVAIKLSLAVVMVGLFLWWVASG